MNKSEFERLKNKSKAFLHSSFEYIEYGDVEGYELLADNNSIILLLGLNREAKTYEYIWAANDADTLINSLKCDQVFYFSFVPKKWITTFENAGMHIRNAWHDYFINDLNKLNIECELPFDFLEPSEIDIASAITKECRDQSRGFTGQTSEWIKEWLCENENAKDTAVLVHRTSNNEIAGILCVGLYGHSSENGHTVWIKEVAVCPEYQNQGIGRKLISQALVYGKQRGAKKAFLAADEENINAIHLYTSLGFIASADDSEITMIKE
ncbi:MAG: GNAT family N-acetyltransferase [Eubacteriales bacterium]